MNGAMKYRTIVADPPWPFRWDGRAGGRHGNATPLRYPLMALGDIYALPVLDLAEDAAHLYLWVTPELYRQGVGVETATAWGFEVVDEIIWEKPNLGMGSFPRHVHEPLLIARRGDLPFTAPLNVRSVQHWSQRHAADGGKVHSAKPDAALDLVEVASPGPYLELFARRNRLGWDTWGNESLEHVELA
jgi:N6-adenosine-specific RNA methylase IME4